MTLNQLAGCSAIFMRKSSRRLNWAVRGYAAFSPSSCLTSPNNLYKETRGYFEATQLGLGLLGSTEMTSELSDASSACGMLLALHLAVLGIVGFQLVSLGSSSFLPSCTLFHEAALASVSVSIQGQNLKHVHSLASYFRRHMKGVVAFYEFYFSSAIHIFSFRVIKEPITSYKNSPMINNEPGR